MKFDGFDPVPWYSPLKRSSVVGTRRILSAAKYASVCGIGVRRSSSPVIRSVGVVTRPTYIRDECASHSSGLSQNGWRKKLNVNKGISVCPAMPIQSVTGQRTAAAAKRLVCPITQLDRTPPPEHPPTRSEELRVGKGGNSASAELSRRAKQQLR